MRVAPRIAMPTRYVAFLLPQPGQGLRPRGGGQAVVQPDLNKSTNNFMLLYFIGKLPRWFYSVIFTFVFATVGIVALDLWKGSELSVVADHDYTKEVIDRRDHGKIGEALAICRYVESQPGMPNRDAILRIKAEIEEEQASWFGKAKRFTGGFIKGNTASSEGVAGTIASDFLVVGDIRDLGKQGYNAATGQEVDGIVTALSALGVASSVAAAVPQPGEPAVASADVGISLLKALRKVNALTNRFAGEAFDLAKEAVKARKLGRFGDLVGNLTEVAIHAPAGTLGTAMKEVESFDDLKAVAKWSKQAPNETIVILDSGGGEWLKANLASSQQALGTALRKGAKEITNARPYLRGAKFLYRGRLQEIRNWAIAELMNSPLIRKILFWFGSGLCTLAAIILIVFCRIALRSMAPGFRNS